MSWVSHDHEPADVARPIAVSSCIMDAERWRRLEALFDRALELPEAERSGFLDEACAGDPELHGELKALLANAPTAGASLRKVVAAEVQSLAKAAVTAQVGRRIGRFRLLELLGEGGMGAVYLAERDNAQFSQRAAIKILSRAVGSPEAIARFRDERQILAALEHPHIVRLLDGGSTDDGQPYLVMEHIEGTAITRYADRHQLSVRARIELVRQVCAALQYAHQNLVVHRDIKPSNILVDAGGAPKILDFGIAKLLAPVASFEREARTRTGFAMFTPEYASPEQARGEAVSTATDVYSVGAVLYELVTGQPAHRATDNSLEILRLICEVDPPRPSAIGPSERRRELAGDLDNIILKALHKEPARRYASMEQLANDLGCWLDGLPVTARTATLGYRARKFVRRNKGVVVATALVAATLIGATVVSLRQAHRADEQAEAAEAARTEALEAARRAEIETDRARKAEARVQAQLNDLKAEQAARGKAEAEARAKRSEAELSREQLQVALAQARQKAQLAEQEKLISEQEKLISERESAKAREAEARAQKAAQAERAARQEAEVLHQQELERLKQRQEASAKITDKLR
ncbi:MAG TPA: protein kinase [Kofleriaceae bacterium]